MAAIIMALSKSATLETNATERMIYWTEHDRLLKVTKHSPMSTAPSEYTVEWRPIQRQEEST